MPTPDIPPPDLDSEFAPYWPSDEIRDAYFLALGAFVNTYGTTEGAMSQIISRFVATRLGDGTDGAIKFSRGLLGSPRGGELSKTIKRVMRVADCDEPSTKLTDHALTQFSEIHGMRDRLVHYGASPEYFEGKWKVRNTNEAQIRESSQLEETWFSIEDLEHMTEDLWFIQTLLRASMLNLFGTMKGFGLADLLKHAWRYKPSGLIRRGQKSGTQPQKH